MSDIKLVKLTSGEEIITTVTGENATHVFIGTETLAAILQPPQRQGDRMSFAFLPWGTLTVEGEPIQLQRSAIIYVANASDEIAEHYKRAFSKLALPTGGLSIVK